MGKWGAGRSVGNPSALSEHILLHADGSRGPRRCVAPSADLNMAQGFMLLQRPSWAPRLFSALLVWFMCKLSQTVLLLSYGLQEKQVWCENS